MALVKFVQNKGFVKTGAIIEVIDDVAEKLIADGYAVHHSKALDVEVETKTTFVSEADEPEKTGFLRMSKLKSNNKSTGE